MFNCKCATFRGKKHIKSNTACQDSSGYYRSESFAITCVADGHGSKVRSDTGSRFAVRSSIDIIRKQLGDMDAFYEKLKNDPDKTVNTIKTEICNDWKNRVFRYHFEHPLSSDEKTEAGTIDSATDFFKNYGTTLLISVHSPMFVLSMQIGDGKIVWAYNSGEARVLDYLVDKACRDIFTTSLSDRDAISEFHHELKFGTEETLPNASIMYTDGFEIEESYEDTTRSATGILSEIADDDAWYDDSCRTLIAKSDSYNKDDVSLAITCSESFDFVDFYYKTNKSPYPLRLSDYFAESNIFYKIQTDGSLNNDKVIEYAQIQFDGAGQYESIMTDGRIVEKKLIENAITDETGLYDLLFDKILIKPCDSSLTVWHLLNSLKTIIEKNNSLEDLFNEFEKTILKLENELIRRSMVFDDDYSKNIDSLLKNPDIAADLEDSDMSANNSKMIVFDESSSKWFDRSLLNNLKHTVDGYGSEWKEVRKGFFKDSVIKEGCCSEYLFDRRYEGHCKDNVKCGLS